MVATFFDVRQILFIMLHRRQVDSWLYRRITTVGRHGELMETERMKYGSA
jgi:hypothetical protein